MEELPPDSLSSPPLTARSPPTWGTGTPPGPRPVGGRRSGLHRDCCQEKPVLGAAKAPLRPAADLADTVETLLVRRVLDQLGLARREGMLISGFEKSAAAIRSGKAAWLIEASDGSQDGRGKLLGLARHQQPPPKVCGAFSADDLSLALGLENVIHAVLLVGGAGRSLDHRGRSDWRDFDRSTLGTGSRNALEPGPRAGRTRPLEWVLTGGVLLPQREAGPRATICV